MKIQLINGENVRSVNNLITAGLRDSLDGTFTLSFILTVDDVDYVNDGTRIEYNGQYFEISNYTKDTEGQSPICAVECEHISYILNNPEYVVDNFIMTGTPQQLIAAALINTPFIEGIIESAQECTITINSTTSRRAVLHTIAAMVGLEIEYNGYEINLRTHRGSEASIELLDTDNVTHVSLNRDLRENLTSYNVILGRKTILSVGDNIHIVYTPLKINVNTRIIAIEYNPYRDTEVDIEVGDYVPDIVDDIIAEEEAAAELEEKLDDTTYKVNTIAADYITSSNIGSSITSGVNNYIGSTAGKQQIIAAASETYATKFEVSMKTDTSEVKSIIEQQVSEGSGTIRLFVEGKGYLTNAAAEGTYTKQVNLSAGISAYISTADGTAKVTSAVSATYQTKSGMTLYSTSAEVTQEIKNGIASITLSVTTSASGNQTTSTITLKQGTTTITNTAVIGTTAAQSATIAASAVNGITMTVTNGTNSSTLTIRNGAIAIASGTITFTGVVTFNDLSGNGTTTINGANITTGLISADRIDANSLKVNTIYGTGTSNNKIMLTSTAADIYLGGNNSANNYTNVYIRANNNIVLSSWSNINYGYTIELGGSSGALRPNSTGAYDLGTSSYRFRSIYVDKLVLGATYGLEINSDLRRIAPTGATFDWSLGSTSYPFDSLYVKDIGSAANPAKNIYTDYILVGLSSSGLVISQSLRRIAPNASSSSLAWDLGTSTYPFGSLYVRDFYMGVGAATTATISFFGASSRTRRTLSTTSTDMSYTSATATNYLTILNNIAGILKLYGLVG